MAVTNMNTVDKQPSIVIYDTAAATPIQGVDNNYSVVARGASFINIDSIPAGTTAIVQCRASITAEWATVQSMDSTNTPMIVDLGNINYTQMVRTGAGVFKAFVQGN